MFLLQENVLNNPLVYHELDGSSNESKNLRQLQSDNIITTLEAQNLASTMCLLQYYQKRKNNNESIYKE